MSWQGRLADLGSLPRNNSLVGTGHIDKAAIISVAGDSVWAATSGFTVSPDEMKNLVSVLSGNSAAVDKAHADGIHIGGDRYVVARIEDRSIYGRQGRNGICVAKTKQAIIIAHHGEAQVAGNATQTTEALADYLIKAGY
ncbi:profilin [Durotheca rogersii]|uniref:profilin n=1 Tax=Durotheca rogersii TaxID=419775 RepID=UPI00221F47D9|nr:profilin [Durotheca rogersii]KAI5866621.1 profilin [Durotheca rogersii]